MNSLMDDACWAFDEAWQNGVRPSLEAFLADASELDCPQLLRELLQIEWEYRRTRGEEPTPEEYVARFPAYGLKIPKWWADWSDLTQEDDLPADLSSAGAATSPNHAAALPADGETTRAVPAQIAACRTRYRLGKLHAQGGQGEVFKARDLKLRRRVALKQIKEEDADDPQSRRRFLREAAITSDLEHPYIVPVYGLGVYPDGRLCYAMRFIRGKSLKKAIADYHKLSICDEAHSVQFRELLTHFINVCNAVAYAHSRNVVHRDLKPSNIKVGKFGETYLLDWGLSKKVFGDDPDGAANLVLSPRHGNGPQTSGVGIAIGTPAFMAPEQAAGAVAEPAPAQDVYSLGAILYVLLTGRPPFDGDAKTILEKVADNQAPPPPRAVRPEAPRPLEAACVKAMARNPEDRYASAKELAAEVKQWLADEPVSADAEPLWTRARRWARKHPSPIAAIVATVLVGIVGLSVGALLLGQKNRQLAELITNLKTANQQLDSANAELRTTNQNLKLARQMAVDEKQIAQAVQRFLQVDLLRQADAKAQADRMLQLGESGFELVDNPTIRELLDRAIKELTPEKIEQKFPQQPRVQAEILRTIGASYRGVGEYKQAIFHLERAVELHTATLGTDHPDTLVFHNDLAYAYLDAGRLNEAVMLFKQTLQVRKANLRADHLDTLSSQNNLAMAYRAAGRLYLAIPLLEQTLQTRLGKLGADHPDTLTSQSNLALTYKDVGRLDKAIPLLEQTLQARLDKLGADHPHTLTSQNNLALAYKDARRLNDAISLLEQTLHAEKAKLGADHPRTLNTQNSLALAYKDARRLDKAIPLFENTLQAQKVKLGNDHPDTLTSQNNLAAAYRAAGQLDEAISLFKQTLQARKVKLGADHPRTLNTQNNLALAYYDAGQLDEAISLFEKTLQARKVKLEADHPATFNSQRNLGMAYKAAGQLDQAILLFEQAFQGAKDKLGLTHPNTVTFATNLSGIYEEARQFDKMEKLLQERRTHLRGKLAADHSSVLGVQAALALCHLHQGRFAEAESILRECLPLVEKKAPEAWTTFHTRTLLGAALAGQKKFAEAEPLLLSGYAGMKQREAKIPKTSKHRLIEGTQRLIDLYDAWGKPDEALKWREIQAKTNKVDKAAGKEP